MSKQSITRRIAGVLAALVTASLMMTATPATAQDVDDDAKFETGLVWAPGEDGMDGHRLPGIAVTTLGTVLAVSEARLTIGDTDPHHLAYKRSLDGGVTWSATEYLEFSENNEAWANPTLLVNQDSGRVFVFYALNYLGLRTELFYKYSDDDGVTWSDRVEVTHLLDGNPQGWTAHVPGPGHALQLQSGRMLVQLAHRKEVTLPIAERDYGVSVLISDDNGVTWRWGGAVDVDPAYPINESRLVERSDGSVLVVGRYGTGGTHSRVSAVSVDGGDSWSPAHISTAVAAAVPIDAGMVRFSGGDDPSRLLFSWPDAPTRSNLTLGLSYDEGMTFPKRQVIDAGASGYSDIAVLDDGTILVMYEVSIWVGSVLTVPEMRIARLNLEWLSHGTDSVGTGPSGSRVMYEAEDLPRVGSAGVGLSVASNVALSGTEFVEFSGTGADDYVEFDVPVPATGTYDLAYRFIKGVDRSQFQATLDGEPVRGVMNAYGSARSYPVSTLGRFHLTAGIHKLRLTVTGKAANSSGFGIGVDLVTLSNFTPDAPGQQIEVTVPVRAPGEFLWSIDGSNDLVDLGVAVQRGDHFRAEGTINPIRVSDTRSGSPAWSVSAQVTDFTRDDATFSGRLLGWTPLILGAGGGAVAGASVPSGFDGGDGLSIASTLGSADAGHDSGSALLGAELDLKLPIDTPEGVFSANLVITALS